MEQAITAPAIDSTTSQTLTPSSDPSGDTSTFWSNNGTQSSPQSQGHQSQQSHESPESLAESMAQVSLSSPSGHSNVRPSGSAAGFAATPTALLGHSNYWSSAGAGDADSSFLNGSTYSPSYSSGGSSSGSPQSPMLRPTSRPITGAKPIPVQPSPMYYPKPQEKQGWKSGQNVWGPYPGPKAGVGGNMGHVSHSPFPHKEKEWKDSRITSPQYPQHQQPHVPSFRPSLSSIPRPGSMSGRPVLQQQQQQPQSQTDWSMGPAGGWGPSLSLHAARKFGRRNRGNANVLMF